MFAVISQVIFPFVDLLIIVCLTLLSRLGITLCEPVMPFLCQMNDWLERPGQNEDAQVDDLQHFNDRGDRLTRTFIARCPTKIGF